MDGSRQDSDAQTTPAPRNSPQAVASLLLGACGWTLGLGIVLAGPILSRGSQLLPGATPFAALPEMAAVVWVMSGLAALVLGHWCRARDARVHLARPGADIAVLGIIFGWASLVCATVFPTGSILAAAREKARRINCASHLKNFGLACRMYSGDYNEWFPDSLMRLPEQDYLTTLMLWTCPSTSTPDATHLDELRTGKHTDYLYFGAGLTEDCAGHDPTKTILGCDMSANHRGFFNVWFADGHVKGYLGRSIQEIAERNALFLPGYNLRVPSAAAQTRLVAERRAARKAPTLIRTVPDDWATDVDPELAEIVVEFDQDMEKGFSWCGGGPSYPETTGGPQWRTPRICVLPVKLAPGHAYSLGINSASYRSFRGANGTPLKPRGLTFATRYVDGVHAESLPLFPQVVKTTPAVGDCRVDPALAEIVAEFDRDMEEGFSWCGGGPEYPETTTGASWRTPRVCVLPVRLEPNHLYTLGLNSSGYRNFRSREGVPLKPYLLVFGTGVLGGTHAVAEHGGEGIPETQRTYSGPHAAFERRTDRDRANFTVREQIEIATLYRTAREKWRAPEGIAAYEMLITKYKNSNRAGCAMIDLGYIREGEAREKCFRAAITDHSDCFYGDDTSVGAEARFLLGKIYLKQGKTDEAKRMFDDLREHFAEAHDHSGTRYVDQIPE